MSRSSLGSIQGPCYVCRTPSHPGALEVFFWTFPHLVREWVLRNRPDAASAPPSPVQAGLADTIPIVPLCCARVLGPIDGEFVSTPGDRRMRYVGVNGSLSWVCLQCHREVHNPSLPRELTSWMASGRIGAPPHWCLLHGPMCYVIDGWMRYFSCCNFEHGDVPLPVQHLFEFPDDGQDLPDHNQDLPDDEQDLPGEGHQDLPGEGPQDVPGDDQDVVMVDESEQEDAADEVSEDAMIPVPRDAMMAMQRLAETYETAEEEIALEALLQSYEP